jgi:lipopolysaccharide transport system ATP-binding protein
VGDVAIRCEGLGKLYRIGPRQRYKTFRDTLADVLAAPFRHVASVLNATNGQPPDGDSTVWALRDVSFEVKRGDVVGIIGRNGAGKSTLLKLLSRITEPTEGYAHIHGRVGSLLEVGTGFHPELTGRENIYLNGALLGLRKSDIARKFDEIVAFADVERFLDTPAKHYSNGMYLRLAFSVAAHLEPDILLVDEVLAVGDAAFQQRCLGKMGNVAAEGRTVLLVSHNLAAIAELCESAILLDGGRLIHTGRTSETISAYLHSLPGKQASVNIPPPKLAKGVSLTRVTVYDHQMKPCSEVEYHEACRLAVEFLVTKPILQLSLWLSLINQFGINALGCWIAHERDYQPGLYRASTSLPGELLAPGRYYIDVDAEHFRVEVYHRASHCLAFDVINTDSAFDSSVPGWAVLYPKFAWTVEVVGDSQD